MFSRDLFSLFTRPRKTMRQWSVFWKIRQLKKIWQGLMQIQDQTQGPLWILFDAHHVNSCWLALIVKMNIFITINKQFHGYPNNLYTNNYKFSLFMHCLLLQLWTDGCHSHSWKRFNWHCYHNLVRAHITCIYMFIAQFLNS